MNRAAGRRPMYRSRAVEEPCRLKHAGRAMLFALKTRAKMRCVQVGVPPVSERAAARLGAVRKSFRPLFAGAFWRVAPNLCDALRFESHSARMSLRGKAA